MRAPRASQVVIVNWSRMNWVVLAMFFAFLYDNKMLGDLRLALQQRRRKRSSASSPRGTEVV